MLLPPLVEGQAIDRTVEVPTTSLLVLRRNPGRIWASLANDGTTNIYLRLGEAATVNTGIPLRPGTPCVFDRNMPWRGDIYAIAQTAAAVLAIEEVQEIP